MKRSLVFFTILGFTLISQSVTAQVNFVLKVGSSSVHPSRYANKDIREYHAFKDLVRKFDASVRYEDVKRAKKIKRKILKRMKNEIQDSRYKLKAAKRDLSYNSGLHQKYSRRNKYSKRNRESKEYRLLKTQVNDQIDIYKDFKRLKLKWNRNFYKQADKHQFLLYEFQRTLKKDIALSFDGYRSDRRYRN